MFAFVCLFIARVGTIRIKVWGDLYRKFVKFLKVEKSSKSQIPIILKLNLSIICLSYLLLYLFIYLLVRPQRKVPTT